MEANDELKEKIKDSYMKWKNDPTHKSVKKYFDVIQTRPEGQCYKRDATEVQSNIDDLCNEVESKQNEIKEKVLRNGDNNNRIFLGQELDISSEDEPQAEEYAKETIFSGFWKTMGKLRDSSYLVKKTLGDVIKKLLKKLIDFFEAGLQSIVVAIGYTIGHIVHLANPLPETQPHPEIGVECVQDLNFINYGETVKNTPKITFFPKSIPEIQAVVRYGRSAKMRVRCAGMKHSWTQMYSDNGEILVYLLPLSLTDTITFARTGLDSLEEHIKEYNSDLSSIEFIKELPDGHAAVRIGAATTNLEMLNWSNQSGWTLPLDIIAVMITYGGSNAMICHGAGLHSKTLSDLVLKIEFIDSEGEIRTEDDPDKLKALAGCFGLAGIVTHVTLKMDAMTYVKFHPKKTAMNQSIPRPGAPVDSPEFQKMVDLCTNNYYVEFFWFPSHGTDDGYWENCWKNDGIKEEAIDINESLADTFQVTSTFLFEVIMKILQPITMMTREEHYDDDKSFEEALKYLFSKTVSMTGHNALPEPDEPLTTSLVEALHFRRGFHYIAVREMEMEIPIPSLEDGSPDWSIVSRAWWDAVDLIEDYEKQGIFAVDMTLELRIMGTSDVLMAPQYGNKHGTLAIEPVSTRIVHKEIWEDLKDKLAKVWMSYKDFDGTPLNTRIHWAKEFPRVIQIDDKEYSSMDFWRMTYKDQMREFFDILSEYNDVQEMYNRYSNKYLDEVFRNEWDRFGVKPYGSSEMGGLAKHHNGASNGHGHEPGHESVGHENTSSCCTIT